MNINEEFFEWMYQTVEGKGYSDLLETLYSVQFYVVLPLDENRLIDGCELRYRFGEDCNIPKVVIDKVFGHNDECSVLEMMLSLAIRIEETIMSDSDYGDRTSMWFWIMIKSLGLYSMTNGNYDEPKVLKILDTFLTRCYKDNGAGSLFIVNNTNKDMRDVEIWYQMCLFFDDLL